jgi:RNA polymerase sigma-70 factor (ECF subfamily)
VSFGEPITLRGQTNLEGVVSAPPGQARAASDLQFIERLRAGETAAFDHLVRERSGDIYALLYRLTEDAEEARDLTQETFLQAFRHIESFRGDADLKTWLYRIAVNQARNRQRWWRRRRRDATISLDENGAQGAPLSSRLESHHGPDPEQQALAREREQVLGSALRKLKQLYREVVILRDVEGLSYEEVSALLNISIGTVKSRLARGRTELRRRLEGSL